ncbi:MAG TPA: hypothetical protein VE871_09990 [Longimicrobium sp.]|nr:hypothetical protein [Longimicrobium sp.]
MLSLDDLAVDSFTTAADISTIGVVETGCIGPCEDRPFTADYC